MSIVSRLLW